MKENPIGTYGFFFLSYYVRYPLSEIQIPSGWEPLKIFGFFFILTVCITSKSLDHYITVKNKKGN